MTTGTIGIMTAIRIDDTEKIKKVVQQIDDKWYWLWADVDTVKSLKYNSYFKMFRVSHKGKTVLETQDVDAAIDFYNSILE